MLILQTFPILVMILNKLCVIKFLVVLINLTNLFISFGSSLGVCRYSTPQSSKKHGWIFFLFRVKFSPIYFLFSFFFLLFHLVRQFHIIPSSFTIRVVAPIPRFDKKKTSDRWSLKADNKRFYLVCFLNYFSRIIF